MHLQLFGGPAVQKPAAPASCTRAVLGFQGEAACYQSQAAPLRMLSVSAVRRGFGGFQGNCYTWLYILIYNARNLQIYVRIIPEAVVMARTQKACLFRV